MAATQSAFREAFRHGELPAFSVACNQTFTFTNAAFTKVNFNVKEFDPDNLYNMTNYIFRPRVSGLYMFNACSYLTTANTGEGNIRFYVNGSSDKSGMYIGGGATAAINVVTANAMISLQCGDSVDMRVYQNSGLGAITQGVNLSYFQGYLVRAA